MPNFHIAHGLFSDRRNPLSGRAVRRQKLFLGEDTENLHASVDKSWECTALQRDLTDATKALLRRRMVNPLDL